MPKQWREETPQTVVESSRHKIRLGPELGPLNLKMRRRKIGLYKKLKAAKDREVVDVGVRVDLKKNR
jgi:hypothetical protein